MGTLEKAGPGVAVRKSSTYAQEAAWKGYLCPSLEINIAQDHKFIILSPFLKLAQFFIFQGYRMAC